MKLQYILRLRLLFAAILFLLLQTFSSAAQQIVVSEYLNGSAPDSEWTELLVTQDNTTIVGYTLRDNGASGYWQGGVRFKDAPLWRNIRAGTIILIHHRGTTLADDDADDGYIEVSAESDVYFEKFLEAGINFTWLDAALNLSAGNDMIQIRDASGAHVHALSHGNASTPAYIILPNPKLNHGNGLMNPGSLSVYPGLSLADYSDPNPGNSKTADNYATRTPGLPNKNIAGEDENQSFWRSLRQPIWNAPAIAVAKLLETNISLSWTAAANAVDYGGAQGYLLLRTSETLPDTNQTPQDGKSYAPNDKLGDWVVIGNIDGLRTIYDDSVSIPCGETYKYRVYAYRYKQDNLENAAISANPRFGRGRSYNETSFAQVRATRAFPAAPAIKASGDTAFCKGGSVQLVAPAPPPGTRIQWQKDAGDIPNQTSATLSTAISGRYSVVITNDAGCRSRSNEIEVLAVDPPIALIIPSLPAKLCEGDSLILSSSPGKRRQWLKDGAPIPFETNETYKVTSPGAYRVIVFDETSCFDTSAAVIVAGRVTSISALKDTLKFGILDDCTAGKIDSAFFVNTGEDTLRIEQATPGLGFSWIAPTTPIIIPPGKQAALYFRFSPIAAGNFTGAVDILAQPCSTHIRFFLSGGKNKAIITASLQSADFGTSLSCESKPKDTTITIHNLSNLPLKLQGQIVSAPYSIASQSFPVDIPPNDSLRLTLRYAPSIDGVFASTLQLPFISGACRDTLRIDLQGVRATPKIAGNISTLSFPPLTGCEDRSDTIITIRNTGVVAATISDQPANPNFKFLNIPLTINPGEDKQLAISFTPISELDASINLPVIIRPCNRVGFEIQVSGSKHGTTFSFSTDSVNFGEIVSCSGINKIQKKIKIGVSGVSLGARLIEARTDPPFTALFNSGIAVKDNDSLAFSFNPSSDGDFTGKAIIEFDPCRIKKTLVLYGKKSRLACAPSASVIDFGSVKTGKLQTMQYALRNSGGVGFTADIVNIASPFRIVSSSIPLPAYIAKDSILTLTLEYAPIAERRDSIVAEIKITQPCLESRYLALLGIGATEVAPPDTSAVTGTLSIAGGLAEAGEVITFPITLASDSIRYSLISSLAFDLSFNGSMLMPRSIVAGNDAQTGFSARFMEMKPGYLAIEIANPSFSSSMKAGELAKLNCEVLLGNSLTTPLVISSPKVERSGRGTRIAAAAPDTFAIKGICPPQDRLISIDKATSLSIKKSGGEYEISINMATNDYTTLKLFDNMGRSIASLISGELSVGAHIINFDGSLLNNGAYFLLLRSGASAITLPFCSIQ